MKRQDSTTALLNRQCDTKNVLVILFYESTSINSCTSQLLLLLFKITFICKQSLWVHVQGNFLEKLILNTKHLHFTLIRHYLYLIKARMSFNIPFPYKASCKANVYFIYLIFRETVLIFIRKFAKYTGHTRIVVNMLYVNLCCSKFKL